MRRKLTFGLAAALVILSSGAAMLYGSRPIAAADERLTILNARLRQVLADAATADQPAPDPERQNSRLVAADAVLTEMAGTPARDRAGLDVKAAAYVFAEAYEVQDGWKLARSIAQDTLRSDAVAMPQP